MSTLCVPASSLLPPLCLGFCAYARSNLSHYVQDTHPLDIPFLGLEFTSQILLEGLRRALQVQCHIVISPLGLTPVRTTSHVSLSGPRKAIVDF